MTPTELTVLLVGVSVISASAGFVYRDARARGLSKRKSLTWAALATQEWPLGLLLYRRVRPRRLRGEVSGAA